MHELGQGRRRAYPLHGERLVEVGASSQSESPRLVESVAGQRHFEPGRGRVGDGKSPAGERHAASSSSRPTRDRGEAISRTKTLTHCESQVQSKDWLTEGCSLLLACVLLQAIYVRSETRNTNSHSLAASLYEEAPLALLLPSVRARWTSAGCQQSAPTWACEPSRCTTCEPQPKARASLMRGSNFNQATWQFA